MILTMGQSSLPAGEYTAGFAGVSEYNHPQFGKGLLWSFEVLAGELLGEIGQRITTDKPTPKNAAGKMLSSIVGKSVPLGAAIDPSLYVGHRYSIIVAQQDSGATRVETVRKM